MARVGGLGRRSAVQSVRVLLCVLGLAAGWGGWVAAAQDEEAPTLHVYANLIQIPVLVLSRYMTPLPPIASSRFSVSLDSGPPFRATHVRPEGDDPIDLSILLDDSGPQEELLPKIDSAIANLAPLYLHAQDRVSIYALDCSLIQASNAAPPTQDGLERAVNLALQTWTDRKRHVAPHCKQGVHLWDALRFVVAGMDQLPGRRVVLVVTDGSDGGSLHTWNEAMYAAQATGTAVFGLAYAYAPSIFGGFQRQGYEDPLNSVCQLSGGVVLTGDSGSVAKTLQQFIKMVRARYIVEFPRAMNSTAGRHDIVVSISRMDTFIRPSGISMPIPDPAVLADPSTVKADPGSTPVQGNRRVLSAPH